MNIAALQKLLPSGRPDTPEAFLKQGRRPETRTLVVCLGDSITQGQVSANYVDALTQRLGPKGYQFVNAGVNGDLAFNVSKRLDAVIACRPDVVTLLVGTNDINARYDASWEQRYRKGQGLSVPPTLEFYIENIEAIVTRLQTETDARVALIEVPILGEDLSDRMNALVRDYNQALHVLAARRGLTCLPLHARLIELLPATHRPPPYAGDVTAILWATLGSMLLRRSWDEVARRNGLIALTDHIHLSDRSAAVVAELIGAFLERTRG